MCDGGRLSGQSAGSGSTRRSTPARACCCIARPMASGASTSSSAGTPTPSSRSSPSASSRACNALLAAAAASRGEADARSAIVRAGVGQRLHLRLPAHGALPHMAGSSSRATRRTACRPSVRAAPTPACRTPTTWAGSSTPCCAVRPVTLCWPATAASANTPPTRTSSTPPRHRLHHAQEREVSKALPRCGARPGARDHAVRPPLVNSGRLSVPATLHGSPLNTPDGDDFAGLMRRAPCVRCAHPVNGREGWLLSELAHSQSFTLLVL